MSIKKYHRHDLEDNLRSSERSFYREMLAHAGKTCKAGVAIEDNINAVVLQYKYGFPMYVYTRNTNKAARDFIAQALRLYSFGNVGFYIAKDAADKMFINKEQYFDIKQERSTLVKEIPRVYVEPVIPYTAIKQGDHFSYIFRYLLYTVFTRNVAKPLDYDFPVWSSVNEYADYLLNNFGCVLYRDKTTGALAYVCVDRHEDYVHIVSAGCTDVPNGHEMLCNIIDYMVGVESTATTKEYSITLNRDSDLYNSLIKRGFVEPGVKYNNIVYVSGVFD